MRFEDLLEAVPDAMVGVDAAGTAVFANARAKALLGRDPVGAPLGELPPGVIVLRSSIGEHELVVLRHAEPSVEQLHAALDNSPSVIYLKDADGRYLLVNRAFARLHGRPPEELVGRLDRELLLPEVAERMRVDDLRVLSSREPIEIQEEVTHGDQTRTFFAVKFPLVDAHGALYGVGGVATDITHHLRLEARLRDAQRLEAVGQLAGGVAHDFNNLLAVIANYAAFVRKELADGTRAAGDADQILTAAKRASDLTRRLLLFSRRQSGTPEVLSVRRVLEGVEHLLRQTLGAREGIRLEVTCDERLWEVEADRAQLEQVLMNLALNAREAMPDGGELRIAATNDVLRDDDRPSARAVRLVVADSGRGMTPEVIAHAFEPFFTTKAAGGIGLGLATVHGIVTKAGGHVELDSAQGRGTTVSVWLPAVRRGAPPRSPPSGAPRGRGETALVVEDADAVRVLTGRILCAAGYQVVPVENATQALERLDAADVLVTDVVMPGMSGVELAAKARERRPDLPVVFVSGYTGNETIAAHDDPATAFLAKPFDGDDLLHAVRTTLDGAARTRTRHS